MKQAIHKQVLDLNKGSEHILMLPTDAKPLFVANQRGQLCMWYRCTPEKPTSPIWFKVVGTGHAEIHAGDQYIGSAQIGDFVWHVFETGDR